MSNEPAPTPLVTFEVARRKGTPLLVSLTGESGSGKTLSGLLLARGLVGPNGKIALLDTENERGLTYADDPLLQPEGFFHASLSAPFTPERFAESIMNAKRQGVGALVIDSASHEWEGEGGVIEFADNQRSGKNKPLEYPIKWTVPMKRHKLFMRACLSSGMHMIFCLRAKAQVKDVNAKEEKRPDDDINFLAVQKANFSYEMTVRLNMDHRYDTIKGFDNRGQYRVRKCPATLIHAFPDGARISRETGRLMALWNEKCDPKDAATRDWINRGRDVAELGKVEFQAWWTSEDTKNARREFAALNAEVANFASIARESDLRREAEKAAAASAETADYDDARREQAVGEGEAADPADAAPAVDSGTTAAAAVDIGFLAAARVPEEPSTPESEPEQPRVAGIRAGEDAEEWTLYDAAGKPTPYVTYEIFVQEMGRQLDAAADFPALKAFWDRQNLDQLEPNDEQFLTSKFKARRTALGGDA